jgi:hypothetical protein
VPSLYSTTWMNGIFWGFADWAEVTSRRMRNRLTDVRILGVIGGLTTVATALVPESLNADLHGWISMWNVEILATAAVLSGVFLYRHPAFWRPIAAWALLTEAAAVLFGFVLHTPPMEWVLIGLILGYVGPMALNLRTAHRSPELAPGAGADPTADPGPALTGRPS